MKKKSILGIRNKLMSVFSKPIFNIILLLFLVLVIASFIYEKNEQSYSQQINKSIPVATITPVIPADVKIPGGFSGNPIEFFDDFSWQSFTALTWPAKVNERGVADDTKPFTAPGPKVFETYKDLAEIFHNDGSAPVAWNQYDQNNACNAPRDFGSVVLSSYSKFSNLGQAGFGTLVGPLIAQNKTYVRFLTAFNKIEFDQIQSQKLYLRSNLTSTITFQNGAIDLKSAWIDMKGIQHPERYYTRLAVVMDPDDGSKCSEKLVGLVGLHIVQKTPSRPQWIWSTFEQIDNISQPGAVHPFTFNDGSATPMPAKNPYKVNPLVVPTPAPYNVDRINPIHSSTQQTNAAYQSELKKQNSVFQFYQLVMTQWPLQKNPPAPIPASQNGLPSNTFPGSGATTAFANLTMETFDQNTIGTGCMACHNTTKKTDFLWALNDHAFPSNINTPNFVKNNPALVKLKADLMTAEKESIKQFNVNLQKKKNNN